MIAFAVGELFGSGLLLLRVTQTGGQGRHKKPEDGTTFEVYVDTKGRSRRFKSSRCCDWTVPLYVAFLSC